MDKLPSHTTRYFAEQAFKLFLMKGISHKPIPFKTVQGVDITATYEDDGGGYRYVAIEWTNSKGVKKFKGESIRKCWSKFL